MGSDTQRIKFGALKTARSGAQSFYWSGQLDQFPLNSQQGVFSARDNSRTVLTISRLETGPA